MRRKIFAATLLATIFLLGACQQSHTNTTATSTKQTSSIGKNLLVVQQLIVELSIVVRKNRATIPLIRLIMHPIL